ncbi:MAG: hypothetical protein VB021_04195 [Oscillospiraceae bacterium]|jgi:hypothetical protein|nr:hypothetical protein [Oscillospiraceae bacterium]
MDDDNIIAELRGVAQQIKALRDFAYTLYDAAAKDILSDRITDAKRITTIMDGLCDFCDEDRFISLYKMICKHIYFRYPEIVGDYVNLFRSLWMEKEDSSSDT